MKAFFSPFRSYALLVTAVALHASCTLIAESQLEDKPLSSTSSGPGGGEGGVGGSSNVGGTAGVGSTGGNAPCAGKCLPSEACCAETCANLDEDEANCGSCGKACAAAEKCCGGACAACCEQKDCPTADHQCVAGTCVLKCIAPKVECGGECVTLDTDPKHCGSCEIDCLSGHACSGGLCQSGWAPMTENGVLSGRLRAAATWTGSSLFVWGGDDMQNALDDGALYDPKTDTWTKLPTANAPSARTDAIAVAMNNQVLVWGGGPFGSTMALNTGKLFDLATFTWKDVATVQSARRSPVAFWTGTKVIVWGGTSAGSPIADGILYDPVTDKWSFANMANAPTARTGVGAAWSGTELLLFGGRPGGLGTTNDGYAYNPATTTWRKFATSGAPMPRFDAFAAWTGSNLLIVGGRDSGNTLSDAAMYDPTANTWASAQTNPLGKRSAPASQSGWTSSGTSKVFVVGGLDQSQVAKVDCRLYDSVANDWGMPLTAWPSGAEHEYGVGVWTGTEFILWSGLDSGMLTTMGDRYRP